MRARTIASGAFAILGVALIGISLCGDLTPVSSHPLAKKGLIHKQGLVYRGPAAAKKTLAANAVAAEADPYRLTEIFAANIVHYWTEGSGADPALHYAPSENWGLFLVTKLEGVMAEHVGWPKSRRFSHLERWGWKRILEKGVGFCSQAAIALATYLQEQGIETEVVGLGGHVVAVANMGGAEYVLDPDYNVVLPHDLERLEVAPKMVIGAYSAAGVDHREARRIAGIFGADGNHRGYATHARIGHQVAQTLKYIIPALMVVAGMLLLRRARG